MPKEWRGTTFANKKLMNRGPWADAVSIRIFEDLGLSEQELIDIGNAEDYLRVSSNVSSLYEMALGSLYKRGIDRVFSFSSQVMPLFAVMMTSG